MNPEPTNDSATATCTDSASNLYKPIFSAHEPATKTLVLAFAAPSSAGSPSSLTVTVSDNSDILNSLTIEAKGITANLQIVAAKFAAQPKLDVVAGLDGGTF